MSIFDKPIVNGLILGGIVAGVSYAGGPAGAVLQNMFTATEGSPSWEKLADTFTNFTGDMLTSAASGINETGIKLAKNIGLEDRINGAVIPAIAASLAGASLTGLVNAFSGSSPTPMLPKGPTPDGYILG